MKEVVPKLFRSRTQQSCAYIQYVYWLWPVQPNVFSLPFQNYSIVKLDHLSISFLSFVSLGPSGPSPSPTSSQTQTITRTEPYVFTTSTPRPNQSRTPTFFPSVSPVKSSLPGHYSPTRSGLNLRPNHKEPSQSRVGPYRKPTSTTSEDPSPGYRKKISSVFFSLIGEN